MKNWKYIVSLSFLICLIFNLPNFAKAEDEQKEKFNAGEVILEHILDSYEWHIFTWKGHEVSIYLPCIVFNEGKCYT
ncbi:MAG: F0F1 ATP synthase subunit A, partial [Bacteroidales bacterium]|nr:F0F1 ATP synthase subunit A [Bacteroidales bacterium]